MDMEMLYALKIQKRSALLQLKDEDTKSLRVLMRERKDDYERI